MMRNRSSQQQPNTSMISRGACGNKNCSHVTGALYIGFMVRKMTRDEQNFRLGMFLSVIEAYFNTTEYNIIHNTSC